MVSKKFSYGLIHNLQFMNDREFCLVFRRNRKYWFFVSPIVKNYLTVQTFCSWELELFIINHIYAEPLEYVSPQNELLIELIQ